MQRWVMITVFCSKACTEKENALTSGENPATVYKNETKRSDCAADGPPYLYVWGGDSLNSVCWAPKAAQQGNCILIQSTPVCVSVIQQTIVSGICIRAMKFNPLAFTMQCDETTVGVLAYLLPCYSKITFTPGLQSSSSAFLLKCITRNKRV